MVGPTVILQEAPSSSYIHVVTDRFLEEFIFVLQRHEMIILIKAIN